jgi:DNA-binding NarL/FixJ family response regulator
LAGQTIRVGLIDGDPDIRYGRRLAISAATGLEIVFEAESAADAIRKAPDSLIDSLVVDFRTKGMDGLALSRRLIEEYLARGERVPAIIITAPYFTPELQIESIRAGATDLITQDAPIEELLKSIRSTEVRDEQPDFFELAKFFESAAVSVSSSESLLIKIGFLDERERLVLSKFQEVMQTSLLSSIYRFIACVNCSPQRCTNAVSPLVRSFFSLFSKLA